MSDNAVTLLGDKHLVFPRQCVLISHASQSALTQHHVEGTGHSGTEKWLTASTDNHPQPIPEPVESAPSAAQILSWLKSML